MVRGISHVTFAVGDLDRAVAFYADVLGCRLRARWPRGAYLSAGALWVALALEPGSAPASGETHTAFAVAPDDFDAVVDRLLASGAGEWRENRSEGASLYVLDPDGHQLEVHVGTLASRLAALVGCEGYEAVPDSGGSDSLSP